MVCSITKADVSRKREAHHRSNWSLWFDESNADHGCLPCRSVATIPLIID